MVDSLHFKSSKASHLSVCSFGLNKKKERKDKAQNPLLKHEAHKVTLDANW